MIILTCFHDECENDGCRGGYLRDLGLVISGIALFWVPYLDGILWYKYMLPSEIVAIVYFILMINIPSIYTGRFENMFWFILIGSAVLIWIARESYKVVCGIAIAILL